MGLEQPVFEEEASQEQEIAPLPERGSNVIEFPKQLEEEPGNPVESVPDERDATLERLRAEIIEFPGSQSKTNDESALQPEGPGGGGESDENKSISSTETFETFKSCDACRGTGRRAFIFKCPVCRGTGRVVDSSSTRHERRVI